MKKVVLRLKEQNNYDLIKRYVDQGGNLNRVCLILNISKRTARRMIAGYKEYGKAYFVHGNRDRKPATKISPETEARIIAIYKDSLYDGANFAHFHELLQRNFPEIPHISLSSLRNIFNKNNILSPKANKSTRKRIKDSEKAKEQINPCPVERKALINLPLDPDPHPRREKSKYFGELAFMDASQHNWFDNTTSHLHAVIDDATGIVLGAYFDQQETLNGYYNVLYQTLINYGIPYRIQTDGRSIFEYAAFKKPKIEKDTYTQFGFACKTLGIGLNTTHLKEYQGKIERLFQTFQSRLIVEMRIRGVKTIKEANEFLSLYLPEHNDKFATPLEHHTPTVFEGKPSLEKINLTLAVLSSRVIDNGNSIRYDNNYFRLIDSVGQKVRLRPKTKVQIIKAFDGRLFVACNETVLSLEKIKDHKSQSFNFDSPINLTPQNVVYIPPMQHPWKAGVFDSFWKQQWEKNYSFDEICYSQENIYNDF